jgi:hypothetical protein
VTLIEPGADLAPKLFQASFRSAATLILGFAIAFNHMRLITGPLIDRPPPLQMLSNISGLNAGFSPCAG